MIVSIVHVTISFWMMSHVFWSSAISQANPSIGSHSFKLVIIVSKEASLLLHKF
ncbi:MAG: hypothetical protein WCL02_01490 [bacterium]